MKKEVEYVPSRCVFLVLVELAKKPGTPMDLRLRTGMTKNNYANIILKNLSEERIATCLNPKDKIGRVFCINPKSENRVKEIFKKKKIEQEIKPLPNLNWRAYGRLLCGYCTQLKIVFIKANELRLQGREITISNLMEKLPKMATGDVYRALYRLVELRVMALQDAKLKKFIITEEGLAILKFSPIIL
jgi:hypothetical protein